MAGHSYPILLLVALVVCARVLFTPVTAVAADQKSVTEQASEAWSRRTKLSERARVTLREERTRFVSAYKLLAEGGREGSLAIPPKDTKYMMDSEVLLNGYMFKYLYETRDWSPEMNAYVTVANMAVSTPSKRIVYRFKDTGDSHPQASVSDTRPMSEEQAVSIMPLMLAMRSDGTKSGLRNVADYQPTGQEAKVSDRRCVVLGQGSHTEGKRDLMYIDVQRDFVPMRVDSYIKSSLVLRCEITYVKHPALGWAPSNWSYVVKSPSGVNMAAGKCTVTSLEVDAKLQDSDFDTNLPPGTFVVNYLGGSSKAQVIDSDGGPGVEVPVTHKLEYNKLRELNEERRRTMDWGIIALIVVVCCLCAVVAFTLRHRVRLPRLTRRG